MNLKAVIFPHRNYCSNEDRKNNIDESGYYDDSMISRLILCACLTVKIATYWKGFSWTAVLFLQELEAALEAIDSLRVRQTSRRWRM